MKIRTFLKYSLVVAGLLFATAFQANAQGQGGGRGGRGMGGFGVLTQEQRQQMREAIQGEMGPLMQDLLAAEKEAAKVALDPKSDESAVQAKLEAVQKVQTKIALLRLKGVKAIASTLTDEQKQQLSDARDGGYNALLGGFGGGMGGRGGRRGGTGGGGGNNQ